MRAGSDSAIRELITIGMIIYGISSGFYCFGYLLARNAELDLLMLLIFASVISTTRILIKVSSAVKIAQEVDRYEKQIHILNA
jgi:hypothetical protein